MKKIIFFIFILSHCFIHSYAQNPLPAFQKPKYLEPNRASEYITLNITRVENSTVISFETREELKNHTFYILKGVRNDGGKMAWNIIAEFRYRKTKLFQQSYRDSGLNVDSSMYRIMVIDPEEKIEYTSIMQVNSTASSGSVTGS